MIGYVAVAAVVAVQVLLGSFALFLFVGALAGHADESDKTEQRWIAAILALGFLGLTLR